MIPGIGFRAAVAALLVHMAGCAHRAPTPDGAADYQNPWPSESEWVLNHNLSADDLQRYRQIVRDWLDETIVPVANANRHQEYAGCGKRRHLRPFVWFHVFGPLAFSLPSPADDPFLFYKIVHVEFHRGILNNLRPPSDCMLIRLSAAGIYLCFFEEWAGSEHDPLLHDRCAAFHIPYHALDIYHARRRYGASPAFLRIARDPGAAPKAGHGRGLALSVVPELASLKQQIDGFLAGRAPLSEATVSRERDAPTLSGYGPARWGISSAQLRRLLDAEPDRVVTEVGDRERRQHAHLHGFPLPAACTILHYGDATRETRYWFSGDALFAVQIKPRPASLCHQPAKVLPLLKKQYGRSTRRNFGYVAARVGKPRRAWTPAGGFPEVRPIRVESYDYAGDAGGLHYVLRTFNREDVRARILRSAEMRGETLSDQNLDAHVSAKTRDAEAALGYGTPGGAEPAREPVRAPPLYDAVSCFELFYYARARTDRRTALALSGSMDQPPSDSE